MNLFNPKDVQGLGQGGRLKMSAARMPDVTMKQGVAKKKKHIHIYIYILGKKQVSKVGGSVGKI